MALLILLLFLILLAVAGVLGFVLKVALGVALGILFGVVLVAGITMWRVRRALFGRPPRWRRVGRGRSRVEVLDRRR